MPAKGEMSTLSTPVIQPAPDVRERLNLNPSHWSVRVLAEIGVAVALAAVLGQLRLFQMPQGGSVSLEMLPIIFIAIRGGVMPALVTGLLYGLLQLILPGAFIYHPAQAALDYPLAFSALAVAGFVPVRALGGGAGRGSRPAPRSSDPMAWAAVRGGDAGGGRAVRVPFPVGAHLLRLLRARLGVAVAVLHDLQPAVSGARGPHQRHGADPAARGLRRGLPGWHARRVGRMSAPPAFGDKPPAAAALFLNGDYEDAGYYLEVAHRAGLLVAADGGARFLLEHGLCPHVAVGDFDSLAARDVRRLRDAGSEVVRHPVRKDATDGELAADEAVRRGAVELVLAGALGALDHTLGHLALLRRLEARGVAARLASPHLAVRVVAAPAALTLDAPPGTRVSLAPLGVDAVVSLEGLEYRLHRGVLPAAACLGLGNAVAAPGPARVLLHEGVVAVLVEDGDETFGCARHSGAADARNGAAAARASALAPRGHHAGGGHRGAGGGPHACHSACCGGWRRGHRREHRPFRRVRGAGLRAAPGPGGLAAVAALTGRGGRCQRRAGHRHRAGAARGALPVRAGQRRAAGRGRHSGGAGARQLDRTCAGETITTIASRMMLAATSSAGTS